MIRALIFDFDGLILETESPIYQSWQELYQSYGRQLSLEQWETILGTNEGSFDPMVELEAQVGRLQDRENVLRQVRQRELGLDLRPTGAARCTGLPGGSQKAWAESWPGFQLAL